MHTTKLLTLGALALALTHARPAAAAPTVVACGPAIDSLYTHADYLTAIGTRTTARGSLGFTSFTMASGYRLSTTPLNTATAASQSTFLVGKPASTYFGGQFGEVFPGRGNNDIDQWELRLARAGAVSLRSITWGGALTALAGQVCYAGPQGQVIVTGYFDAPGYGTDLWSFVVRGDVLKDIRKSDDVTYTMVNGRLYDAKTMNEVGNRERKRKALFWEREGWAAASSGTKVHEGLGCSCDRGQH